MRGTIEIKADEKTGNIDLKFINPGMKEIVVLTDLAGLRAFVIDNDCRVLEGTASEKGMIQARAQLEGVLVQIEELFLKNKTPIFRSKS